MAHDKFQIALVGVGSQTRNLYLLEKVLKKFFAPSQFIISCPSTSRERLEALRSQLKTLEESGKRYKPRPGFEELGVRALLGLENDSADVALAIDTGYSQATTKPGIQSHFEAKALLLEPVGKRSSFPFLTLYPQFSVFEMPFLGTTGSTEEQRERGYKTVMRGAIEGWKFNSNRWGGVLSSMRLAG